MCIEDENHVTWHSYISCFYVIVRMSINKPYIVDDHMKFDTFYGKMNQKNEHILLWTRSQIISKTWVFNSVEQISPIRSLTPIICSCFEGYSSNQHIYVSIIGPNSNCIKSMLILHKALNLAFSLLFTAVDCTLCLIVSSRGATPDFKPKPHEFWISTKNSLKWIDFFLHEYCVFFDDGCYSVFTTWWEFIFETSLAPDKLFFSCIYLNCYQTRSMFDCCDCLLCVF